MAEQDELKLGTMLVREGDVASPLPLENTQVEGDITGPVATITVSQTFANPYDTPISIEYLFPLPDEAALIDYEIHIGERHIRATLQELKSAREIYAEAKEAGQRASLLEQRRPNLFSIQVSNIQPNEAIITRLRYDDRLHFQDGTYEFLFPMGITPRFHREEMPSSEARQVEAPVVLENSAVAPVSIALRLHAGLPINLPSSQTHEIEVEAEGANTYRIQFARSYLPNKDFVLRYQVAEDAVRVGAWASRSENAGEEYFLLSLLPPRLDLSQAPISREFIFVLDRSGSMQGDPMEQAKNALRACLRALGTDDSFMIQMFNAELDWFKGHALPVTQANIEQADHWINQIRANGGTAIIKAMEAALQIEPDPQRQRYVVFLTDGAVSAEEETLQALQAQRQGARIFTFGIGPSVNRFLLKKMAQMGQGTASFMGVQDDIEGVITRFQDRVSYPVMQDIELQWQQASIQELYPPSLPDLYVGQALELVGKLQRQGGPAVTLRGHLGDTPLELSINLPTAERYPALARLWQRAKIEHLMDRMTQEPRQRGALQQEIVALSLQHGILTPFTAFVATDSSATDGGESLNIKVAVPLPEGLSVEGFVSPPMPVIKGRTGSGFSANPPTGAALRLRNFMPDSSREDPSKERTLVNRLIGRLSPFKGNEAPNPEAIEAAGAVLAAPTPPSIEDGPAIAPAPSQEERLRSLARTQHVNGSWEDNHEITAAAVLAFVRAGHSTRTGNYRRQVSKAAQWLLDHLKEARGFAQFVSVRALEELHSASGDYGVPMEVRRTLPTVVSPVERAAISQDVSAPAAPESLDDVRIVALLRGNSSAPPELQVQYPELLNAWMAVGEPAAH